MPPSIDVPFRLRRPTGYHLEFLTAQTLLKFIALAKIRFDGSKIELIWDFRPLNELSVVRKLQQSLHWRGTRLSTYGKSLNRETVSNNQKKTPLYVPVSFRPHFKIVHHNKSTFKV
jgi:hypothetical protein